jgi:hypothetical protein
MSQQADGQGATLEIVNPVALAQSDSSAAERVEPAPRRASLDGARIGLYWNGKPQGDVALAHTKIRLAEAYDDVTFVDVFGEKGGLNRYLSPEQLEMLARDTDVVVGTSGDCGSCTAWLIRDMVELEKRGVATANYTSTQFIEDAHWSARIFGLRELPITEVPLPFTNRDPATIASMVDDALARVVESFTRPAIDVVPLVSTFSHIHLDPSPTLTYGGDDLLECFDRMQDDFVAHAWSDGMPLVPPTRAKVDAMIAASGLPGDHVVGNFAPGNGIGTIEKIAANAVMAGAAPNAMPVILAMLDCVLEPSIGLRTFAMSTGPQAPVVMVSGPYAEQIGMNNSTCALGPGSVSRVNVAIGRTLRLCMMNVGHSYPGVSDMDTIGSSMKFGACVAENEARNPWLPFRVQQGYSQAETTVTVNVPYGVCELFDFQNYEPEKLIECFATVASNTCGSPSNGVWLVKSSADLAQGYPFHGFFQNLVMLCPEHASVFSAAGWTIDDIKKALHDACKMPFRKLMLNKPEQSFRVAHPELLHLLDAPETEVDVFPTPDCWDLFVVGSDAGRSLFFFGGTNSVTKPVRLP